MIASFRTLPFLAPGLVLLGCAGAFSGSEDFGGDPVILPGERVGPVTAETSHADLVATFGAERVRSAAAVIGEGFCAHGAILFPGTPHAIEVAWTDSSAVRPSRATVAGVGGRWRTSSGVRVGTTLEELVRIQGEPVAFTGFAWDYGGTVEWDEPGTPEAESLILRLVPDSASYEAAQDDPRASEILGEELVTSEHPLIRDMDIQVERIILVWSEQQEEATCE